MHVVRLDRVLHAGFGRRDNRAAPRGSFGPFGLPSPDAVLFYNEMTVLESTPGSYFMAAGWNTGYFGIQELSDGRKVILFSVWDPTQGDDPNAVKQEERVECLYKRPTCGSGVSAAKEPAASAWAALTGRSARRIGSS